MGGEIGVRSQPGQGSTFWFTVVLHPAPEPTTVAPDTTTRNPIGRLDVPLHVLLVEDNHVNQRVAAELLRKLGCTVAVVEDGAEAVAAVSREAYDLIFMDCHMPGMDGFAATRVIRSMGPVGRDIPIIALTADVLSGGAQRCAEAGMTEFLAKPIDVRRLGAVLKRYVRHRATEPSSRAVINESQP